MRPGKFTYIVGKLQPLLFVTIYHASASASVRVPAFSVVAVLVLVLGLGLGSLFGSQPAVEPAASLRET